MNEQEIYTPYDAQINALEERLAQLRAERNNYINQFKEIRAERDAYENTYESVMDVLANAASTPMTMELNDDDYDNAGGATNDGLKNIANPENPIPVRMPMYVRQNLIYATTENDGIKDIVTRWVALENAMLTEDTFSSIMERYDLAEDEE